MRTTTFGSTQHRIAQMMKSQERLEIAEERVVTGKRIGTASDNPAEIGNLLRLKTEAAGIQRRISGANAALPNMKATETSLADMAATLREVRTQALQANGGTLNADQRTALADHVERLSQKMAGLANTRFNDRALFAGTATDAVPFPAADPMAYAGSPNPTSIDVGEGQLFETSVTGARLLNARGGTDLFANLGALADAIRAGDSAAIGSGLSELDKDLENVVRIRGDVGARIQYVESVATRGTESLSAVNQAASDLENIDFTEAVLQAGIAETAHEATLAMAGRLQGSSLLDYLR